MSEKWQEHRGLFGGRNYVLYGKDFAVSYNPDLSVGTGSLFDSDDGGPETALVHEDRFYILNGDFREAYEKLVPQGFTACKAFYDQQAAHADSSWTTKTR